MKAIIFGTVAVLFIAGCESNSDRPHPDRQGQYQPIDGRNLGPGLQDASHGDPQFPADIDRSGGGGPR